jgi:hypothetical protein
MTLIPKKNFNVTIAASLFYQFVTQLFDFLKSKKLDY